LVREGAAVALSDTEAKQALTIAPNQGKRLEVRDLERAFAKLPDDQRSALLLVSMEGMKYEEAAAVLGVAVGTIRSRVSRGREILRDLMDLRTAAELDARRAALRRRELPDDGHAATQSPR
jgi:RNA polymerase sigma-70 factor (ECF subfamily)